MKINSTKNISLKTSLKRPTSWPKKSSPKRVLFKLSPPKKSSLKRSSPEIKKSPKYTLIEKNLLHYDIKSFEKMTSLKNLFVTACPYIYPPFLDSLNLKYPV